MADGYVLMETSAALRRQKEAAALEGLKKAAPFESIEDATLSALENGFFEQLVLSDTSAADADSMRKICTECNQITEMQLHSLFNLEASIYSDVPKTHKDYQQLLDLESILENEATAWKVIADLVTSRTERPANGLLSQSTIQASSEKDFVTQWKMQQDAICDAEVVTSALEEAYGKRFPVALLLSTLMRNNPSPAELLFGDELQRLKCRDSSAVNGHRELVELAFESIYRCLRAGDWSFAYHLCKESGMGLFSGNFLSRRYSQSADQWTKMSNLTEGATLYDRRLKWRQLAWDASDSARLGTWEKAVWGVLCGNYKAILPVAESWEDEVWIYSKCFVDIATEKAIAKSKPVFDGSGLPAHIWQNSFSLEDIFTAVATSENSVVSGQSENIFRHSIRCALLNDSKDMLVEVEKFILEASALCSSSPSGEISRELRRSTGSGIRFALHSLLLMQRADIAVDPVLFGRCCYFYVLTSSSSNPELWASYLSKIPEDLRGDAVSLFFSQGRLTPSEKADFLAAMARRDLESSLAVFRSFTYSQILSNPLHIGDKDAATFGEAAALLVNEEPSIRNLVFAVVNRVFRSLLLPEPVDARGFHRLFTRWTHLVHVLLNMDSDDVHASLKAETFCWKSYMAVLKSYSNWHVVEDLEEMVDDFGQIKEEARLAGYHILSTADWLAEDPSSEPESGLDFDTDRNVQLKVLRARTLSGVYAFVIAVLNSPADRPEEVSQLKSMLEVSRLIMGDFTSKIGNLTQVEDSFEKVKTTAHRISSDIRYANYLDHSLKRSIGQFESDWKKLRDS
ncbi:hypothetical protein RvY_05077 [Ramazzottius varieornatus]|uniref:Nuclear pore complex protein n=1 Tax=Ramazzottius varieornatus TaxID=947166 RepID=A0A1D1UTW5_RAMVA|nr:hypothetical protein RvY_05077 [Ramazzottius varieornatus]